MNVSSKTIHFINIPTMRFIGALVVVLSQTSDHKNVESHVFFGTMIVLLQVTAMANLLVFQKPLLAKYDPSIVTFTYYSTGTALTLVLCLLSAPLYMKPSDLYFNNNTMPWFGLGNRYCTCATIFFFLLDES